MAKIGQLEAFQPDNERMLVCLEWVQMFFAANSVKTEKQVLVLLSVIGAKTYYTLLSDLLFPEKLSEKTFRELQEVLLTHYKPKPLVIVERFHFHWSNQAPGECISDYVVELCRLTTLYTAYLNKTLRDKLVCGIRSEGTQKRLLSEANLSLAKAIEFVLSSEAAEKNA